MIILTSRKIPSQIGSYFENIFFLPDNPDLDPRISFHTDLSVFSFGDTVVCAPYLYSYLTEKIGNINVISGEQPKSPYPYEVLYNAALVGDKLFCNVKYTSPTFRV